MKNSFYISLFFLFFFFNLSLAAQDLEINSETIRYDDAKKVTIFEGKVNLEDKKGNKIFSNYAEYNKISKLIVTKGKTNIVTSGGYEVSSSNITFDDEKKLIFSNYKTQINDVDGNKVLVDMFNYSINNNIFFSKGNIKIFDIKNNNYNFSEIYIDEKKKKIIGSDVKAFLNQDSISINKDNQPRLFANTMSLDGNINTLEKGVFTYCKNRENDKCPPWTLQSDRIKHDLTKKTIFYDNVVLKIYDFPLFFFPKFSHPDPTVKRRSGFLAPSLSNSSTLGSGFSIPYFLDLGNDRDLTLSPKLYFNENPLMLAEYRQDFKKSYLIVDSGYTQGYKKKDKKKTAGGRSHFFSFLNMELINEKEKKSNIEINLQKVSNDTYFKIYDLDTSLVKKNQNVLENNIDFTYQNEDLFFGMAPSIYEDIDKLGNLRNEYLLPITFEKKIMSNETLGFVDLTTNLKFRNYETNKQTNFLVNDFNWKSNKSINKFGFENYFEGLLKTVNYEANKTDKYKNAGTNSELSSALGYFAKLGLYKNDLVNKNFHTLTPRFLLRYAPAHMRKLDKGRLNYGNLFNLNKTNELDVIESGLSTSLGFEYKKNKLNKKNNISDQIFSLSVGQVVSAEENTDISSRSSMDQKFSDVVGVVDYNLNDKINLNYNFSVDQGYNKFNYNEVGADLNIADVKFNINYLQEKNHIGNQEFINTGVDLMINSSTELSLSTKRNLLTDSAEFYNLSYNYINDCLKAGIAYRREFYRDRDVEPTNNLMFTISIIPFAQINSPSLARK